MGSDMEVGLEEWQNIPAIIRKAFLALRDTVEAQEQEHEGPLPPIPEPRSADEASLRLAQFNPFKRTPEGLKSLLEARASPDIVIPTETRGFLCPLEKVLMARDAHVPIFFTLGPRPPYG